MSLWLRLTALAAAAGTLLAVVSGAAHLGTAHRVLAALVAPPLAAVLVSAWLTHRRLVPWAAAACAAFAAAALFPGRDVHAGFASLAFALSLVLCGLGSRRGNLPVSPDPIHWSADADKPLRGSQVTTCYKGSPRDYVTLTKPRVMSLLLLTGFCGMIAGARGWPGLGIASATMVGLALACGGASALNHVLDRDIDPLMGPRTRSRPVAAGRVAPAHALEFGLALSAFSFVLLASAVNVLTATLALVGNLFYVLVYTRWLKRRTVQNIVIGGAAGAVPPLVGWAAATGELTLPALWLFLIVFLWTPPHFWALALLLKEQYAAARVPMLPVMRGERETARQIVLYSLALVAITFVPFAWHTFGWTYLAAALVLGSVFVALAARLRIDMSRRTAALLFHYSLLYLALLFIAMAIDPLV
jgi:protoheme IX farnesyltransferase